MSVRYDLFLVYCLMPVIIPVALAQERVLRPFDEGLRDVSFMQFRDRLLRATRENDTSYVFSVVAPDVINGFDSGIGLDAFRRTWDDGRGEGIRYDILRQLPLGGSMSPDGKTFEAPYTWTRFPDDLDGYEYGVVIGNGVNVRSGPSTKSDVIARVSYAIISIPDWMPVQGHDDDKHQWYRVWLRNGRKGYIVDDLVRSPIDTRFWFTKTADRWYLKRWVAGN